jgi:maltose phosphorylase
LRSVFIKQADVLQGVYLFEDHFSEEVIKDNFYYYEPKTVHESSLSPCVHSILAAKIGDSDKAYEMYLRTSRLDLDDYNKEVHEGLHITSMAGTWMSIVEGMAGVRVTDNGLAINPTLPKQWSGYTFKIYFKGNPLVIACKAAQIHITNNGNQAVSATIYGQATTIENGKEMIINR